MAELIATMRSFWAITKGSLTYSVGCSSISGLSSTQSYSALGADDESGDDLAGVDALARVGQHARFHQVDHAIGEQLDVNAQVALVLSGISAPHPGWRRYPAAWWRHPGSARRCAPAIFSMTSF